MGRIPGCDTRNSALEEGIKKMAIVKMESSLQMRGDSGSPRDHIVLTSRVPYISVTTLTTFSALMEAHSLCNAEYFWRVVGNDYNPGAPGAGANVDKKGVIFYRDPATLVVYRFTYPCPIAADIEDIGYGKRLKQAAVIAIVDGIEAVGGGTYEPLYGAYQERL